MTASHIGTGVVIVGAGHAGVECAFALRAAGYLKRIVLLGDEPHQPYQRPPLSKDFLAGRMEPQRLALRSAQVYQTEGIELITGNSAVGLDVGQRQMQLRCGQVLAFEHCVLATGARARSLPELQGAGVHAIRTLDDALTLQPLLKPGCRLLVIGGGYLGLEAASTAAKLGAQVTVLESAPALISGRVSPHTASSLEALHRQSGIHIVRSARVVRWVNHADGWRASMDDGTCHEADIVLVAAGAQANTELAISAGLGTPEGIEVDASCRTADAAIYAIGDCALALRPALGRHARVESVQNALEQARIAAASLAGQSIPALKVSTFWSEQQGRRLQMAGLLDPRHGSEDHVVETSKGWVVERYQSDRLAVVEAVDSPVDFVRAVKRIGSAFASASA